MKRVASHALTFAAAVVMTLSAARAAPIIQYQFSSDATLTDGGLVLDITGGFDYDVALAAPTSVDLTVSNGGTSEVFNVIENSGICQNSATFLCAASAASDFLGISFLNSLDLGSVDPLGLTDSGCGCRGINFLAAGSASAVTGDAQPVAEPVAEPTSLALFGSALLASVVLRLRRHGRKHAIDAGA